MHTHRRKILWLQMTNDSIRTLLTQHTPYYKSLTCRRVVHWTSSNSSSCIALRTQQRTGTQWLLALSDRYVRQFVSLIITTLHCCNFYTREKFSGTHIQNERLSLVLVISFRHPYIPTRQISSITSELQTAITMRVYARHPTSRPSSEYWPHPNNGARSLILFLI